MNALGVNSWLVQSALGLSRCSLIGFGLCAAAVVAACSGTNVPIGDLYPKGSGGAGGALNSGGTPSGGTSASGVSGGARTTGGVSGTGGSVDCNCLRGAYGPVCGSDGLTHDATCGDICVPVPISCRGECPCPTGAGGASAGIGGAGTSGGAGTGGAGGSGSSSLATGGTGALTDCVGLICGSDQQSVKVLTPALGTTKCACVPMPSAGRCTDCTCGASVCVPYYAQCTGFALEGGLLCTQNG